MRDYGAKGDSKTLDTAAVQAAIDACANDRGGTMVISSGRFRSGRRRAQEQRDPASCGGRPSAGQRQSGRLSSRGPAPWTARATSFIQDTAIIPAPAAIAPRATSIARICSNLRVRIHNRVNLNNDGFHLNSNEYVNIVNCNVMCQDDACALFGGNRLVTVTNCTFSTRWSIFRFGGS